MTHPVRGPLRTLAVYLNQGAVRAERERAFQAARKTLRILNEAGFEIVRNPKGAAKQSDEFKRVVNEIERWIALGEEPPEPLPVREIPAPQPPEPQPSTCEVEAEGESALVVRPGRAHELVWEGTTLKCKECGDLLEVPSPEETCREALDFVRAVVRDAEAELRHGRPEAAWDHLRYLLDWLESA